MSINKNKMNIHTYAYACMHTEIQQQKLVGLCFIMKTFKVEKSGMLHCTVLMRYT